MTHRNIICMQPQFDDLEPDQGPVQFGYVPTCQQLVNVNMGPAAGFYSPCLAPVPNSCRFIPGYVYPPYVSQAYQLPGTPWDYVNVMPSVGAYPYFPQPMMPTHPAAQMQATYPHPMNNPHGAVLGHPSDVLRLGPRIPPFQPPPQHPMLSGVNRRRVRIVQSENSAFLDMSRLNEMESAADELRDMRLDIDGMSYEELLDLEARIGDVKTGLSKDFIVNNLRTHLHEADGLSSDSDASRDDTCIICQGEYDVKDCIGTLDCGHMYHSDCIKQWLVLKNLCPICKKVALSTDRRDG